MRSRSDERKVPVLRQFSFTYSNLLGFGKGEALTDLVDHLVDCEAIDNGLVVYRRVGLVGGDRGQEGRCVVVISGGGVVRSSDGSLRASPTHQTDKVEEG